MKTLKSLWLQRLPFMLCALLILITQARCDLSLPGYTSSIVDTGIARGGIEESLPYMIPEEMYLELTAECPEASEAYLPYDSQSSLCLERAEGLPLAKEGYYLKDGDFPAVSEAITRIYAQSGESSPLEPRAAWILKCYTLLGADDRDIQMGYIISEGLKMLSLVFLSACLSVVLGYLSAYVGSSLSRDIRERLFKKVLSFSPAETDGFSVASLITRSTSDVQQVQMMTVMLMRMVSYAPIMAIGGTIKVFETAPSMRWVIGVGVLAIGIMLFTLMRLTMPRFRLLQKLIDNINRISRETLGGMMVIRAFGSEKRENERFKSANGELTSVSLFVNRVMGVMNPGMNLVMNGTTLLIVLAGARQIGRGLLQVGDMMAFITYSMQIISAFLTLGMVSVSAPRALVSVGRIAGVLEAESSIKDGPEDFEPQRRGEVAFENVSFSYPQSPVKALSGISFRALPGTVTAVIGQTGSGKSTLANLLMRFYDVQQGRITIDGRDIRDFKLTTLRDIIGYVPQRSLLFSGTAGENIAFGLESYDEKRVRAAAADAQADRFISSMEDGYGAYIAQGGSNLSGGQKQRVAIARALAKNSPVYIFDDSFSALDLKTDLKVREAIAQRLSKSTVIIIAQRISTVMNCDNIIVLSGGKIAGMGRHRQLLETCPQYKEIALSQLSEKEL